MTPTTHNCTHCVDDNAKENHITLHWQVIRERLGQEAERLTRKFMRFCARNDIWCEIVFTAAFVVDDRPYCCQWYTVDEFRARLKTPETWDRFCFYYARYIKNPKDITSDKEQVMLYGLFVKGDTT